MCGESDGASVDVFRWWKWWAAAMSMWWHWGPASAQRPTLTWCAFRTKKATTRPRPSTSRTNHAKVNNALRAVVCCVVFFRLLLEAPRINLRRSVVHRIETSLWSSGNSGFVCESGIQVYTRGLNVEEEVIRVSFYGFMVDQSIDILCSLLSSKIILDLSASQQMELTVLNSCHISQWLLNQLWSREHLGFHFQL